MSSRSVDSSGATPSASLSDATSVVSIGQFFGGAQQGNASFEQTELAPSYTAPLDPATALYQQLAQQ